MNLLIVLIIILLIVILKIKDSIKKMSKNLNCKKNIDFFYNFTDNVSNFFNNFKYFNGKLNEIDKKDKKHFLSETSRLEKAPISQYGIGLNNLDKKFNKNQELGNIINNHVSEKNIQTLSEKKLKTKLPIKKTDKLIELEKTEPSEKNVTLDFLSGQNKQSKVTFNLENNKYYFYDKNGMIHTKPNFFNKDDDKNKLFVNEFSDNVNITNMVNANDKDIKYNELINDEKNIGKSIGEIYDNITNDGFMTKNNMEYIEPNYDNENLYSLGQKYNNFDTYSFDIINKT